MIRIVPAPGSYISIGGNVNGGLANRVMFTDANGALAQSVNLAYDGTKLSIASGQLAVATGGVSTPSFTNTTNANTGINISSNNTIYFSLNGGAAGGINLFSSTVHYFGLRALGVYGFSSTTDPTANPDTALNRVGPGIVGVNTSANAGTAGAFQGTHNSSDGTAGVSFTGAVATLTVKDGIVVGHT